MNVGPLGNTVYIQPAVVAAAGTWPVSRTSLILVLCVSSVSPYHHPHTYCGLEWRAWAALQPVLGPDSSTHTHIHMHAHTYTHTRKYTTPLQYTVTVICSSPPYRALFTRCWGGQGWGESCFCVVAGLSWVVPYNDMEKCISFQIFSPRGYISS